MSDNKDTPLQTRGKRADDGVKPGEPINPGDGPTQEQYTGTGGPVPDPSLKDPTAALDGKAIAEKAARDAANRVGPGHPPPPLIEGAEAFDPDEPGVMMNFPEEVILTTDQRQRVHFPAGVVEVPVRLADHWYLKAHGVTRARPVMRSKK